MLILLALAVLLPVRPVSAVGQPLVSASDADYRQILSLQKKAGMREPLPAGGATQEEMILALAALSDEAQASGGEVQGWKGEDYDAMFALLQNYREQLKAARARMSELEARGASMAAQETELEKRLDRLPPDGFKINGEVRFVEDTIWLARPDPASGSGTEFIHGLPGLTLFFVANKGLVSAKARYDINTILGDFGHQEGLRLITVEMRTPLVVLVGNFYARMTPLTVWRNEDYEPFEPEPFKSRRQRLREDVLLDDNNAWNIKAARLVTDLVLFEKQTLNLEAWWTVPYQTNNAIYHEPDGGLPFLAWNTIYMAAWRMGLPLDWFTLEYTGTKSWEQEDGTATFVEDTGVPLSAGLPIPGFNNEVHSLRLEKEFFSKALGINVEYARSLYSNPLDDYIYRHNFSYWNTDYLAGGAFLASAHLDSQLFKAKVNVNYVTSSFVSPISQGRTFDPAPFATSLLMENTTYNSGTGSHGNFPFATYNETYFNGNIVMPLFGLNGNIISNAYLIPWPLSRAAQPYGPSTPNRMGVGGRLDFLLMGGALEPLLFGNWQQEPEDEYQKNGDYFAPKGSVIELGAGMHVDLEPAMGLPVKLVGGLRHVNVGNLPVVPQAVSQVEYATNSWDAGIEWVPWQGGDLAFGYVAEEVYGNQYLPLLAAALGFPIDTAIPLSVRQQGLSLGLGHKVNDWTRADLSATQLFFPSRTDSLNQDELRQFWAKFSIFF